MEKSRSNIKDKLLWLLMFVMAMGGLVLNNYFQSVPGSIRAAAWVLLVCVLLGLAYLTNSGRSVFHFFRESQYEIFRVTWPGRPEAVQMTIVVAVSVFIMALMLWVMDSLLLWLTGQITG